MRKPFCLKGTADIQFAAAGEGERPKLPTFDIAAYNGGALRVGWGRPVVVDLNGLRARQETPVLLDHVPSQVVGQATSTEIDAQRVRLVGQITGEDEHAQKVLTHARNGFKWQASIGVAPSRVEAVDAGAKTTVNGQEFAGPLYVVRAGRLGEVSFVAIGADDTTLATIAARAADDTEVTNMDFSQWLEARGFVEAELSDAQRASLLALYQAECDVKAAGEGDDAPDDAASKDAGKEAVAPSRVAAAAELRRQDAIIKACGENRELAAKAIEEAWDVERTRMQAELTRLRASRPNAPLMGGGRNAAPTERVLEAAAMLGSGLLTDEKLVAAFGEETLDAAERFRGIGLRGIIQLAAQAAGVYLPVAGASPAEFFEAAASTLSLPGIMSNIANKAMLEGYGLVDDPWREVVRIGSVKDFKEITRYRLTSDFDFEEVGPDGELKHGSVGEVSFSNRARTYGKMFSVTREDIVNDDLGALTEVPYRLGEAAARKIPAVVWGLLLKNASSFFSTDHKNYLTGTDTALTIDGLTKARNQFAQQLRPDGKTKLNVPPTLLVVPDVLEIDAAEIMGAREVNQTPANNKRAPQVNPHYGKFKVVSSGYLSDTSYNGASSLAWYLFADPRRVAAVEVVFLNGQQQPMIESKETVFEKLGIQFRGIYDFGAREQDYRAALKMKGEA